MDEQRALMDMLMGKTRDNTEEERKTMRRTHFSDSKICKYALCGMCPYALFKGGSRSDIGVCPFKTCLGDLELGDCIAEYEALTEKEKERYGYERDLLRVLEGLVRQVLIIFNFVYINFIISRTININESLFYSVTGK